MRDAANGWLGGRRPPHVLAPVVAVAPDGVPGVREGMRALLRRVFGARTDLAEGDADPGLCGPASASWQVIAEPAAIAGGVRALLLQTLHPLAMAGVAAHSTYRDDPLARLRATSAWVTTSTFGTTAQVLAAAHRVRAVHRRVYGTAPDGRAYRAADPRLLVWVSVALTSSFLAADRLWAPEPVTGARADAFVAEQSRLAALLDERVGLAGLRADPDAGAKLRAGAVDLPLLTDLPHTVDELVATLDGFRSELEGGRQARETVRFLRRPPIPPAVLAGYVPLFAGAAGSLPAWQRAMLGLRIGGMRATTAVVNAGTALATMRTLSGRSPAYAAAARRVASGATRAATNPGRQTTHPGRSTPHNR